MGDVPFVWKTVGTFPFFPGHYAYAFEDAPLMQMFSLRFFCRYCCNACSPIYGDAAGITV